MREYRRRVELERDRWVTSRKNNRQDNRSGSQMCNGIAEMRLNVVVVVEEQISYCEVRRKIDEI